VLNSFIGLYEIQFLLISSRYIRGQRPHRLRCLGYDTTRRRTLCKVGAHCASMHLAAHLACPQVCGQIPVHLPMHLRP